MMTFSLTLHNDDPYCQMMANKSMIIKYWSLLWHLGLFVCSLKCTCGIWSHHILWFVFTIFCGLFLPYSVVCFSSAMSMLLKKAVLQIIITNYCLGTKLVQHAATLFHRNCCDFSPLLCPQGRSVGPCTANEGSLWHVHLTDLLWHLSTSLVHFSRYTNPDFPLGFVNPALSCICCSSSESDLLVKLWVRFVSLLLSSKCQSSSESDSLSTLSWNTDFKKTMHKKAVKKGAGKDWLKTNLMIRFSFKSHFIIGCLYSFIGVSLKWKTTGIDSIFFF